METPTRADLARFDRSRKNKKTSNKEWKSPQDPDAKIAKMKDGRTHLAHKAEHGVDLETGAIVSVTVQDASDGDSATLPETLLMAVEQVELVQPDGPGPDGALPSVETTVRFLALGDRNGSPVAAAVEYLQEAGAAVMESGAARRQQRRPAGR